jgi:gamma-glutamylcyclotransferase (GGCT)/AIG2-like uncharacterized protein YtfP
MKPYFAYGSNLWLKQMEARCPEHRILGSGLLAGYRWIITTRGCASVVRSVSDLVLGVVYGISETDEESLDLCEWVPDGSYRKALLPVQTGEGEVACLVYVDRLQQEGAPRQEYAERIKQGIRDAGFPTLYVERYLAGIANLE